MFVLAHLSDPHLGPVPTPRLAELAGKRALGFLNWHRKRRAIHRPEILDLLVRDLVAATPDHIAVTGDLVNLALAAEFAPALTWLAQLGPPDRVTVVPGNHDAYVRAALGYPQHHWGNYMRGDAPEPMPGTGHAATFPFVRRRGPVVLFGLSTAIPTAPFLARGRLGADQLMRLADTLEATRHQGLFRIVLIHHPPVSPASARLKRLTDAGPFRRVIARHGAELVLHGHAHVRSLVWLDGPDARVPAIGVPSASALARHGSNKPAAYHLFHIGDGGTCEMIARGLRHGAMVEIERRSFGTKA